MWSNVAHEMTVEMRGLCTEEEEIHELLLSFAEAGAIVVRLKGGDPLVFGRGGEEMDFLQQQGIQVKVIPVARVIWLSSLLWVEMTQRKRKSQCK
ncbi:hypothetical protein ACB094_09G095500 [Castanea mollissima]